MDVGVDNSRNDAVENRAHVRKLYTPQRPDGNGWLLQEVTTRIPGREWDD